MLDVFLSIEDVLAFSDMLEATKYDTKLSDEENNEQGRGLVGQMSAIGKFCASHNVVRSWDFQDRDGNDLDPTALDSYTQMNVRDHHALKDALMGEIYNLPKDSATPS